MATVINTSGAVGHGAQGWAPGLHDENDRYYVPKPNVDITKFPSINLRAQQPLAGMTVYDQGNIGSCVANASSLAFWYELRSAKDATIETTGPSRYFLYWNALNDDNNLEPKPADHLSDNGTWNRHAAKLLKRMGNCTEATCPYVPAVVPADAPAGQGYAAWFEEYLQRRPADRCFDEAPRHTIKAYYRLDADRRIAGDDVPDRTVAEKDAVGELTLDNVKRCLADGHPVVFAFRYYWDSIPWESGKDGVWRVPDVWAGADPLARPHADPPGGGKFGGHAVVAVGYDDAERAILVQNSWGVNIPRVWESVGGLLWMPYSWIRDFAATNDFWTFRLQDGDRSMTETQVNEKVSQIIARQK